MLDSLRMPNWTFPDRLKTIPFLDSNDSFMKFDQSSNNVLDPSNDIENVKLLHHCDKDQDNSLGIVYSSSPQESNESDPNQSSGMDESPDRSQSFERKVENNQEKEQQEEKGLRNSTKTKLSALKRFLPQKKKEPPSSPSLSPYPAALASPSSPQRTPNPSPPTSPRIQITQTEEEKAEKNIGGQNDQNLFESIENTKMIQGEEDGYQEDDETEDDEETLLKKNPLSPRNQGLNTKRKIRFPLTKSDDSKSKNNSSGSRSTSPRASKSPSTSPTRSRSSTSNQKENNQNFKRKSLDENQRFIVCF